MIVLPHILAKEDPIVLAVIAIFVLIGWAMKAISAFTENAKKQAQRRAVQNGAVPPVIQPNVGRPGGPVVNRAAPGAPRVAVPAGRLPPVARLAGKQSSTRQGARRIMPKQNRAIPAAAVRAPAVPVAAAMPVVKSAAPALNSTTPLIASWMKAQTLRSQFILSEAMQPPLGLRTRSHLP